MAANKTIFKNPSIAILKREPEFAALIKKHGLPAQEKRRGSIFQALVRSIIYQQVSGKAAATIFARFIALFDENPPKKKGHKTFPTPEQVSAMSFEKLRAAGLSGQKASYVHNLAEKFSDGTIKHRALARMQSESVIEHLVQVKGVGVWTAQMILISTLGRPDILPTGDLGIQKGFQIVYKLRKLPDHKMMERLAKPWRAHSSVACWYLWRAADQAKLKSKVYTTAKR
jgi:3-methyladenine DNA glycosylase/8-oxoguanine DNA glycosylase